MPNDYEKIRITSDEVNRVVEDPPPRVAPAPGLTNAGGSREWGEWIQRLRIQQMLAQAA